MKSSSQHSAVSIQPSEVDGGTRDSAGLKASRNDAGSGLRSWAVLAEVNRASRIVNVRLCRAAVPVVVLRRPGRSARARCRRYWRRAAGQEAGGAEYAARGLLWWPVALLWNQLHGLTPLFAACYKEVFYVCGRYGQVVSPCCQATRNGYSDAAKLNPVWKWKRVRNSGPYPRRTVNGRDIRNRKDVP